MKIPSNSRRLWSIAAGILVGATMHAAADEIVIGANMPLTGPFAASGNYVADGARIAVDEINARGGLLGQNVRLVVEDNKSNPTEAAAVAEKLIIRDNVPVILGAWGSSLTLATMPKLMQYEVPMVVETSGADKITLSGNPYVFRIAAPAYVEAAAVETLLENVEIKKVDFLVVNNDWGLSTVSEFSRMFEENGVEVGLTELMDQAAQDVNAQLTNIKASSADTLIVTAAVEQLTLVLKQIQSLGLERQVITTGGSQNPDQLIENAGSAADGTMHLVFFAPWSVEKTAYPEKSKAFIDAWAERGYDFAGLTESFRGYDGINVIAAAIEEAGVAEPAAIQEALWKVEAETLNGPVSFVKVGPSGRESGQSNPQIYFVRIEDGKVKVID